MAGRYPAPDGALDRGKGKWEWSGLLCAETELPDSLLTAGNMTASSVSGGIP